MRGRRFGVLELTGVALAALGVAGWIAGLAGWVCAGAMVVTAAAVGLSIAAFIGRMSVHLRWGIVLLMLGTVLLQSRVGVRCLFP